MYDLPMELVSPAIILSTSGDDPLFPLAVFFWFVIAALILAAIVLVALKK